METRDPPVDHACAWTGAQMRRSGEWVVEWPEGAREELAAAAANVARLGKKAPHFDRGDFPLPTLRPFLERVAREVTAGRGFVLLRGLRVDSPTGERESFQDIYWGLGCHWGRPITQNVKGDHIAEIVDRGLDAAKVGVKPSLTNAEQRPHTDPGDVVALLCVHGAKEGGVSRIASAVAIYNRLLEERPRELEILHRGFHHDLRGDESPEAPFGCTPVPVPVYRRYFGVLSCVFNATSARQAAERMSRPIPGHELALLDRIVELARSDELRLDMTFQPGDIQLLNNHTVLHWRTGFVDWPEPERKRRLYRMWINRPGERLVDPQMRRGYIAGSKAGLPILEEQAA
jgi:hypothetical protein